MEIYIIDFEPNMVFKNDTSTIVIVEVLQLPTCDFPYIEDIEEPVTAVKYIQDGNENTDTASYLSTKIINDNFKRGI